MAKLLFSETFCNDFSVLPLSMLQDIDGNYILVGRAFNNFPNSSGYAIKVASGGIILWEKIYSGPFTQFFNSVAQLNDGNYIATGSYFYSNFSGDEYIWVVKLNKDGEIIWQKALGKVGVQSDGNSVFATKDGGFIVAGTAVVEGKLVTKVYKFSSTNNLEWNKTFNIGTAHSIIQTKDGGYAISGASLIQDSLNTNAFILRLNSKGDIMWKKVYDEYEIYVLLKSSIIENSNCNLTLAAKSLLMQVDCSGNIIWASQNDEYVLNSVVEVSENSLGIAGSLIVNNFDHAYVAKIDNLGENTINDNTEITYPSQISQVILNSEGLLATCGYLPKNNVDSEGFLAIF